MNETRTTNDLAQQGLRVLRAAVRHVGRHPAVYAAGAGLGVGAVIVVAGAQVGAARPTIPLTSWLGLQDARGVRPDDLRPGALLLAGLIALVLLWAVTVQLVRQRAVELRQVWWVGAAWSLPFAFGPPLVDTSVYSSAAYGLLQRGGHDPYSFGASRLHRVPVVFAIDPSLRDVPSSSGPLGSLLQHLSVSISGGSALGAVVVLRAVAVLAVVWAARRASGLAASAADTDVAATRVAVTLALVVLNPLVLLYLISGAHLDALMIAMVLAALVAARQRRWTTALLLGAAAGSLVPIGFVVVPVIARTHLVGRRGAAGWRALGGDAAVVAGVVLVCRLALGDGFGWVRTLHGQFAQNTTFSVASALGRLVELIVRGASFDDVSVGSRVTTVAAACFVIGYVIATGARRTVDTSAAYALLAAALLAPVLHPWYLLWPVLCLAPAATRTARIAVFALSVAGCVIMPPGFATTPSTVFTVAALAAVAAALAVVAGAQWPPEISRTAGRTSAR